MQFTAGVGCTYDGGIKEPNGQWVHTSNRLVTSGNTLLSGRKTGQEGDLPEPTYHIVEAGIIASLPGRRWRNGGEAATAKENAWIWIVSQSKEWQHGLCLALAKWWKDSRMLIRVLLNIRRHLFRLRRELGDLKNERKVKRRRKRKRKNS